MVMDEFNTIEELYNRVYPALHSKYKEFCIQKLPFLKEKVIWKCLCETKWKNEVNLSLFDLVNDILNVKQEYVLDYINQYGRK